MKRSTADFPGPVGIMHDLGNARLIVEAQPLLGAAGEQVQMAAHRPEEPLGAVEAAEFGRGEQPGADEIGRPLDAVDIFADPVERVEVAKAALAVLDVGFDDVAAVAHADVPLRRARRAWRRRTRPRVPATTSLRKRAHGRVEQLAVAPQPARFEEGRADGHVLPGERKHWRGRADRVADLELEIPQQVERWLRPRAPGRVRRRGGQEHQVEIAERRHFAAAGAAEADQREPRADRFIGQSIGDEIIGQANDLVVEEGGRVRGRAAAPGSSREPPGNLGAAVRERVAQDVRDFAVAASCPHGAPRRSASPADR